MHTTLPVSSLTALRLAASAGCDPRTAARALRDGPQAIRGAYVRERIERAMLELGVAPTSTADGTGAAVRHDSPRPDAE